MADESEFSSDYDIGKLPLWARVAFAARCARRVLPLFEDYWPSAPIEYIQAVRKAIESAEQCAATAEVCDEIIADKAAAAASAAYDFYDHGNGDFLAAALAADAASFAARAASTDLQWADRAVEDASRAIETFLFATKGGEEVIGAIWADFDHLVAAAKEKDWNDSDPVPSEVFGSLWPNGLPPSWPKHDSVENQKVLQAPLEVETPAYSKLAVKALIKPGVSPEALREGLIELYWAMNEYHMARGAGVLSLEDFRQFVRAEVAVEV